MGCPTLNTRQRWALIAWVACMALLVRYPPFYQTNAWPPEVVARFHDDLAFPKFHGPKRHSSTIHFDWSIFALEVTALGAATGSIVYLLRKRT